LALARPFTAHASADKMTARRTNEQAEGRGAQLAVGGMAIGAVAAAACSICA
jgi:hypothetical protein